MVAELLEKYIWLIQTFIRAGEYGLTFQDISNKWENRFNAKYPRRTFNNHRGDIESIFNIVIECNRSTNCYYIDSTEGVRDDKAESKWLINTFTVNQLLSLGKERLSGRVAVENIPSGHLHLTSVLEAMTENKEIVIQYKKYSSEVVDTLTIRPYAVKEQAKRWYIIAYCVERKGLRVYGLDRVRSVKLKDKYFKMPLNFDIDEIFATSFGIYLSEGKGQKILFRTSAKEAQYLRDLPIHSSQCEESNDGENVIFSLFLCPADAHGEVYNDFMMELCKYGSRIEVLSPIELREAVAEELSRAADIYR